MNRKYGKIDAGGGGGPAIGVSAYHNTTESHSGADNPLAMNSEDFDTDGFHDTSTNNERFTIPAGLGGTYLITASTYDQTGGSDFMIRVNGTTTYVDDYGNSGDGGTRQTSVVLQLNAGDYVEPIVTVDSGSDTLVVPERIRLSERVIDDAPESITTFPVVLLPKVSVCMLVVEIFPSPAM